MARAYTMQKLLGATTPVPYHDMFAFVRSVNEAHSGMDPDTSLRSEGSQENPSELEPEAPSADVAVDGLRPSPSRDPKRATLMRSVSARDVARLRMFRKIDKRRDRDASETRPAMPAPAPAPAPTSPRASDTGNATVSVFSDDSSSQARDSASTSSWRLSLYDYDRASPTKPPATTAAVSPPSQISKASRLESFPDPGDSRVVGLGVSMPSSATLAPHRVSSDGLAARTPNASATRIVQRGSNSSTRSISGRTAVRTASPSSSAPSSPHRSPRRPPSGTTRSPLHSATSPRLREPESGSALAYLSPTLPTPPTPVTPMVPVPLPMWRSASESIPSGVPAPALPVALSAEVPRVSPGLTTDAAWAASSGERPRSKPLPRLPEPTSTWPQAETSLEAPLHRRTASVSSAMHDETEEEKKEARVVRLFGSLRRKTSRRGLAALRRAQKENEVASLASLVLLGESNEALIHEKVVTLPLTPAALMRWNQTLTRPVRHVLSQFPADIPLILALEPPRRLLRVIPLLQAAGDEYVKLRYVLVFSDVIVLAKPAITPTENESLSEYMLRKLQSLPDLGEACTPFAVLDLASTTLEEHSSHSEEEIQALLCWHGPALETDFDATMTRLAQHAMPPTTQAQLLFACPTLDRRAVSRFLYRHADVLEAYVAQHKTSGVPLDWALRAMLLDVCWPADRRTFDGLLHAFAVHWYAYHATEPTSLTLDLVHQLTLSLMALNDAWHNPSGLFAPTGTQTSLDTFMARCRAFDPGRVLRDQELSTMYMSIRTSPLLPPSTDEEALRTISFDPAPLATGLAPGMPSAPIRVRIEAPDPELRVRLVGRGLYIDPPVLSFAHAAEAECTICPTTPGPHDVVLIRTGRHAPLYAGHVPRPGWQALPRHWSVLPESGASRPTVSLVHTSPLHGQRHTSTFYMTNSTSARHISTLLQTSIDAAQAHARSLSQAELDIRSLGMLVLDAALLTDDTNDARRRPRPRVGTGLEIVRTTRECSLLPYVLGVTSTPAQP